MITLLILSHLSCFAQKHLEAEADVISLEVVLNALDDIREELVIAGVVSRRIYRVSLAAEQFYLGLVQSSELALTTYQQTHIFSALTSAEAASAETLAVTLSRQQAAVLISRSIAWTSGIASSAIMGWTFGRLLDEHVLTIIGRLLDRDELEEAVLSDLLGDYFCQLRDCNRLQALGIETTNQRGFH